MSELVPFTFEHHHVRTIVLDGEPWFVAADTCAALALRDTSSALKMVDPEDIRRLRRSDTPQFFEGIAPQVQEITVVNESGVYALIFHSRKPEAKRFKRWITHEVIPQLRKAGHYAVQQLTNRELAQMVIAEADRADAAEALAAEQTQELATARPKAAYVDAFINPGEDVTTIRDFAKELGIREKDLREYLVRRRRIYKRVLPRRWSASKQREDVEYEWRYCAGFETWFALREQPDAPRRHNGQIRMTLYVTPVGKERIRRMLEADPIGSAGTTNVRQLPARRDDNPGGAA